MGLLTGDKSFGFLLRIKPVNSARRSEGIV